MTLSNWKHLNGSTLAIFWIKKETLSLEKPSYHSQQVNALAV